MVHEHIHGNNNKKYNYSTTSLILVSLILTTFILSGCSIKGEFSKEGAYEILRGISNSQNPIVHDEEEDIDYPEYMRKQQFMH